MIRNLRQVRRVSCDMRARAAFLPAVHDGVMPADYPTAFEQLQARLLARALRAFPQPHFERPLRQAILHAARTAEWTGFPMLVLPELFREIAIAAMAREECGLDGSFACAP